MQIGDLQLKPIKKVIVENGQTLEYTTVCVTMANWKRLNESTEDCLHFTEISNNVSSTQKGMQVLRDNPYNLPADIVKLPVFFKLSGL